jgi:redox-sensitive bicupin YhaK (pirin superfamily)
LAAEEEATALLVHGLPIGEPVVAQGPFVMNTREEIVESIQAYQSGRMGHLR